MDDDGRSELQRLDEELNPGRRFVWGGADGAELLGVLEVVLDAGLAVRVSLVGYGMAVRLSLTDGRGWSTGWTLGSGAELRSLLQGLLAPGGLDYVRRRLEKPRRR